MPEDRIEYMLDGWAKYVAEKPAESATVDTKDCYFDKECHKLVDWKKVGNMKDAVMARMKWAMENDKSRLKNIMTNTHKVFTEAGMPEDRIDYMLEKWLKYVAENNDNTEKPSEKNVDTKDCYFDEECHKLVNWEKIGKMKEGILARMRLFKGDDAKMKNMMTKAHELFKEAGMPDDRIDYILEKWAKGVPKEHFHEACAKARFNCIKGEVRIFEGKCRLLWAKCGEEVKGRWQKKSGDADKKDCYFDEECHKLVDWKKIGQEKATIFAKLKWAQGNEQNMKEVMTYAHKLFKDAGMPEDRIDYILEKWAKGVAARAAMPSKEVDKAAFQKKPLTNLKSGWQQWMKGMAKRAVWHKEWKTSGSAPVKADPKDCYFDKECHKLVDWDKIAAAKDGILARMKMMQGDEAKMQRIMTHTHELFKKAGMPEDRINYTLRKWAASVAKKPADSMV